MPDNAAKPQIIHVPLRIYSLKVYCSYTTHKKKGIGFSLLLQEDDIKSLLSLRSLHFTNAMTCMIFTFNEGAIFDSVIDRFVAPPRLTRQIKERPEVAEV